MFKKTLKGFRKEKKEDKSSFQQQSPSTVASVSTTSKLISKFKPNASNLSQGLESVAYSIDELQNYGIAGRVKQLAFDPIQSLMAVVTEFNHVLIFGQSRVSFTLKLTSVNAIRALRFIKGIYLLAVDAQSTIYVISLHSKKVIRTMTAKLPITAFETDYSLEFVYIGLSNGLVRAFNVETGKDCVLNLREQQKQVFPFESNVAVRSLKLHPRDIGTLLISYTKVTVAYNLLENKAIHNFIYVLPKTAPGGENAKYEYDTKGNYVPSVMHSLWHPNGLHILTVHDDNSIVFWDAKTGEMLLARTLFDSHVDSPTGQTMKADSNRMTVIKKIAWLCEKNPEHTSLLLLGGDSYENEGYHQLVRMDFGKMLSYSMTSYNNMANYYAQPKQQNIFAIHSKSGIHDFVALGESSPYFDGNHDPKLIAVIMNDGTVKFLNYPMGNQSFEASHFPATISWLNPKITCSSSSTVDRRILNGIIGIDKKNTSILKGGIPSRPKYRADVGSLVITGHESGYIRIWNSSEGDLDCSSVFEIDISGILLNDSPEYSVSKISFAGDQLELACSLFSNDVLLFAYQTNKNYQPDVTDLNRRMSSLELSNTSTSSSIIDISDRAPRNVKKGFLPQLFIKSGPNGKVTALCNSNVGFVAIGYESGVLMVVDKRGNKAIFNEILKDSGLGLAIVPTALEFGFGSNSEGYSTVGSILMFVGTSAGRLLTYELVTDVRGKYFVKFITSVDSNDYEIKDIIPIDSGSGRPCYPTIPLLKTAKDASEKAPPLVITSSSTDIRISKAGTKGAHKTFSKGELSKVGITGGLTPQSNVAFSVVAILGASKKLVTLSLPGLLELVGMRINYRMEPKFATQCSILPLGDIFLRITETEAALVNIMKMRQPVMGLETTQQADLLFLRNILVPNRPVANSLLKSTPNITYDGLYELLMNRERKILNSSDEETTLSWEISPYNPRNYNILGTAKPVYYDPSALHQHPTLSQKPVVPNSPNLANNVSRWGKTAQNQFDITASRVQAFASDANDEFDKVVEETKRSIAKSMVPGGGL